MAPTSAKGSSDKGQLDQQTGSRKDNSNVERMTEQAGQKPGAKGATKWKVVKNPLKKRYIGAGVGGPFINAVFPRNEMDIEMKKDMIQSPSNTTNVKLLNSQKKKNPTKKKNEWTTVKYKKSSLQNKLGVSSAGMDTEVKKEVLSRSSNELYLSAKTGDEFFNEPNQVEQSQNEEDENMSVEIVEKASGYPLDDMDTDSDDLYCGAGETKEELMKKTNEINRSTNAESHKDVDMEESNLDGNKPSLGKRKYITTNIKQSPKKKLQENKDLEDPTGIDNEPEEINPENEKITMAITPEKNPVVRKTKWIDLEEEEDSEELSGEEKVQTKENVQGTNTNTKQVSIQTFADRVKGKKKSPKENNIRLRFTYNAKKAGNKPQILHLLTNLMEMANLVDKEAMIMPWDDKGTMLDRLIRMM